MNYEEFSAMYPPVPMFCIVMIQEDDEMVATAYNVDEDGNPTTPIKGTEVRACFAEPDTKEKGSWV